MAKRWVESMQKALRDELEKDQVNELVALKEGEIMVTTSEELPCNFVLQSTHKEFYKCTSFSQVACKTNVTSVHLLPF